MPGFLGSPPRSPSRRRFAPRSPQRSIRFALRCFTLLEDDGIEAPEIDDVADASIDEDADEARDDATARDAVGEKCVTTDEDSGLASATWDAALQRYQRETSATEDGNEDPAIVSYGESDAGSSGDEGRIDNWEDNAAEVTKDLLQLERDSEFEHFSLQVEMAKGAFLRNPCEERWEDLVHSFQLEMWRRLDGVHNSQMEVLHRLEREEADEPSGMVIGAAPGGAEDAITEEGENESEVSAPSSNEFEENAANQQLNEMSSVGAPKVGNAPAIHNTASVEVDPPLCHVENGSISSEEMAMDGAFADFGDDDCWVERDVSMSVSLSSEDKTVEDSAGKQTPSQETSSEETATKAATKRSTFKPPSKSSTNRVLAEVLHWEKQIERYDQRYVAVVAAALDETQGVAWKEGQIVEVVPSAWVGEGGARGGLREGLMGEDEEILYVV
ncbi:hypothetical protein ACHAXT_003648 [Thalassiosira profunda]